MKLRTTLIIRHQITASHSLEGNEKPHPHLWKIEARISGEPVRGRIIDLPELEKALIADTEVLEGVYLNECQEVDEATRGFPTCESLGASLLRSWDQRVLPRFRAGNPSLRIASVQVTLCDPDGREYGAALIEAVQ